MFSLESGEGQIEHAFYGERGILPKKLEGDPRVSLNISTLVELEVGKKDTLFFAPTSIWGPTSATRAGRFLPSSALAAPVPAAAKAYSHEYTLTQSTAI